MRTLLSSLLVILFVSSSTFLIGQDADEYQTFDIYQIQLGAFKAQPDLKDFSDLKDLGKLSFKPIAFDEPEDDLHRVFLGTFLGKETALKVMEIVRARGYEDAVYDVDDYNLNHSTGKSLRYTLQLAANKKKYNISGYDDYADYVLYQKGFYRICFGLYPKSDLKDIRKQVLPGLKKKGIKPYFRKFR